VALYFKMQYLREGYGDGFPNVLPGGYVTSSMFLYRNWCRLRDIHERATPRADTFGRFGLRFSAEIRSRAIRLLTDDARLEFVGGTSQTKSSWYLREMARSRTCLDLPGQGPFCYRLVEAFAMGCCVIGPRHATRFPIELSPGENVVHCADDLHDLPDLCVRYSRSLEDRSRIGQAAAAYFDRHLHPARVANMYLEKVREISA
jgi:glycosyltransferase involved in cell wall biosynthesis